MQIYTADSRSLGYAVVKSVENVPQPINATGQSPTYPAVSFATALQEIQTPNLNYCL